MMSLSSIKFHLAARHRDVDNDISHYGDIGHYGTCTNQHYMMGHGNDHA